MKILANITFRKATLADLVELAGLAVKLWPDDDLTELIAEFTQILTDDENNAVFVCEDNKQLIAFGQVSLRHDYVEGTDSSPVGYMEALFVEELYRGRGIARKLFEMRSAWAKQQGCSEVASDTELTNLESQRFHEKIGFEEANRIVCYVRKI